MQWLGDRFVFSCRDGYGHHEVLAALGIDPKADGGRYSPPESCVEVRSAFADDLIAEEEASAVGSASANGARPPLDVRRAVLTTARQITSQRTRWTWRRRIAARSMTVVAGEKGLGKSALTNAYLVAGMTRGELAGEYKGRPLDVLVLTIEDASGEVTFTLPDDVALVERQIAALRDRGRPVGLLVVDPIGAFLAERTDSHKDASVRRALAPLAAMAERLDLAVVVVAHLTKDEGKRLLSRVSGSGAFVNAARSVLVVGRDPNDPEGEAGNLRVLIQVASNWGRLSPALACHVEGRNVRLDDGSVESVPLWVIDGESSVAVEDLQGGGHDEGRTEVEEEIAAVLAEGAHLSRNVKAAVAGTLRVSRKTVERHAVAMAKRGELVIREEGDREEGAEAPRRFTEWALADADEVGTRKQGQTTRRRVSLLAEPACQSQIRHSPNQVGTRGCVSSLLARA
jgi:AAA domain